MGTTYAVALGLALVGLVPLPVAAQELPQEWGRALGAAAGANVDITEIIISKSDLNRNKTDLKVSITPFAPGTRFNGVDPWAAHPSPGGLSQEARQVLEQSGNIGVRETEDSIVLSITSDILFEFDSNQLSDKAQSTLVDVAKVLNSAPDSMVRVVGHTDAKGSEDYNMTLSEARANAVVDFLLRNDVRFSRMTPEGRGESDPVAPNEIDGDDNPEGRAQNRRVEFVLPKG